jgi:glutaryl-CoA dehydrogenase
VNTTAPLPPFDVFDPAGIDDQLTADEIDIRASVRALCTRVAEPYVANWFETGVIEDPRALMRSFGEMGLLGMHLEGYGCAGLSAVDYGLACLELEACDSGIRSLVSVQGSLAMFAIWRWGSEEHKQQWLPRWPPGRRSAASASPSPTTGPTPGDAHPGPPGRRRTGCSTVARCGSRTAPSPTWQWSGRRPTRASEASSCPPNSPGFSAPEIKHKMSLRASVTSELVLDGRPAARLG